MSQARMNDSSDTMIFTGNIYIFHTFDVGDDVDLLAVSKMQAVVPITHKAKHFKHHHAPLAIQLKNKKTSTHFSMCKVHNFGGICLTYKIAFQDTLKNLKKSYEQIVNAHYDKSLQDALAIFQVIEPAISQPTFAKARSSYSTLQIDPHLQVKDLKELQKIYGDTIASMLRLETETLSEYQISEIWESAIGYYREELMVIDADSSFIYTKDYLDIIDLFEFGAIHHLELRFFDRVLDEKLNEIYEGKVKQTTWASYMPFYTMFSDGPIEKLWKMKVDISVITERLESSIKIANEKYLSEIHQLLTEHMEIKQWQESIDRKLKIIESVQTSHQHKIETNREDMISILITILIFIELVIGILNYFGK